MLESRPKSVFSNRIVDYKWNSLFDICATANCATMIK